MAKSTEPRPGEGRFDALVRLLGSKDPQTRQEAAGMFCQAGKRIVPPLIIEAIKPGKRSQHRIAILDVVQRIGGPLDPESIFRLRELLRHRVPEVREKAELVILSLLPDGVPKTPEALARMRMFNPFLQPPLSRQALRKALRTDPDVARLRREFYAERRKERERDQGRM